jgi:hypothetical protein
MRLFGLIILFSSVSIVIRASDQAAFKRDTIENVIYEYDTIYMPPDTIRVTDTIINYQLVQPLKEEEKTNHWLLGTSVLPFVSNLFGEKSVIDSFSLKQVVNYNFNINIQYHFKSFVVGLGGGFTRLHDRLLYHRVNNFLIGSDSISVNNTCTADNYYRYFNIILLVGKKWGKQKIKFTFNASLVADILIDYKAILPVYNEVDKIYDTSIRKIGLAVMISPSVSYKLGKKFDFFLSPFYRYNLNKRSLYPLSNLQDVGIGAGFSLIL